MKHLPTILLILFFYGSCSGISANVGPFAKTESTDKLLAKSLYLEAEKTLDAKKGINATQWLKDPFADSNKKVPTKTEEFVARVLKLKTLDPFLFGMLQEKAFEKIAYMKNTLNPHTGEIYDYVLFLKLVFQDKQTWISYVKEKAGWNHIVEKIGTKFNAGTPDRRFQDSMAPLLIQLDPEIKSELLPLFSRIYNQASKKYMFPSNAPGGLSWSSKGQGPKRLIDSFVRYASLPEYKYMNDFSEAIKDPVHNSNEELAAGEAYEKYLADVRKVSGFPTPASNPAEGTIGLGLVQADYDTSVMARVLFTIQKELRKSNTGHNKSHHAVHIIGGSFPRGTSTLGGSEMSVTLLSNGREKKERPGSDIDSLVKLRNGEYLGLQNRNRAVSLTDSLTASIRQMLEQSFDPTILYNLEVADDKLSTSSFVRSLNEFDLSKINPILLEVGESHICLLIHNYSNKTTSNTEIQNPGVMVFPIQSHFQKALGLRIKKNEEPCATKRSLPLKRSY